MEESRASWISSEGAAAFLLRLALGVLFFFAGLGKFLAPGGISGVAGKLMEGFKNTYLPVSLTGVFLHMLPFIEVTVGAALIVGILTREALIVCGLLLIVLAFGMMLQANHATVADNLGYVFMTAAALWFSARDNRYSLDHILKRR